MGDVFTVIIHKKIKILIYFLLLTLWNAVIQKRVNPCKMWGNEMILECQKVYFLTLQLCRIFYHILLFHATNFFVLRQIFDVFSSNMD